MVRQFKKKVMGRILHPNPPHTVITQTETILFKAIFTLKCVQLIFSDNLAKKIFSCNLN